MTYNEKAHASYARRAYLDHARALYQSDTLWRRLVNWFKY